jgi:hypothetical protein
MAVEDLHPPGQSCHRSSVDETRNLIPKSQIDQQHYGSARPRKLIDHFRHTLIATRVLMDIFNCYPIQLVLTSMHKYVPRIHVIAASDYASLHWGMPTTINTAAFNVCSFIAVTAYAVSSKCRQHSITNVSITIILLDF